jgi:hypothetical protein
MLLHQPHAPGISRESAKQGWQKESVADSQPIPPNVKT